MYVKQYNVAACTEGVYAARILFSVYFPPAMPE